MASSKKRLFDTADEAAIHFAKAYTLASQASGNEHGAVIFQGRFSKKFRLSKVHIGNSGHVLRMFFKSFYVKPIFIRVAGTIHSHPRAYKTIPPNNWCCGFSYYDRFLPGIRYLCAPNGVLYKSVKKAENTIVMRGLSTFGVEVSDQEVFPNH